MTTSGARPAAWDTILLGGLAIGILDFLDATLFFALYAGGRFKGSGRVWRLV